ncbi:hypothetical protein SAY87_018334 [Trapa incisa]|uniref:Uncharacterized protein n=1 Tax=Trapa incisa TaxID=236973 RepID=A0AAN7LBY9_9MYRT|nr:hypothetical protein SAY87_018334 [Trapa incisa]
MAYLSLVYFLIAPLPPPGRLLLHRPPLPRQDPDQGRARVHHRRFQWHLPGPRAPGHFRGRACLDPRALEGNARGGQAIDPACHGVTFLADVRDFDAVKRAVEVAGPIDFLVVIHRAYSCRRSWRGRDWMR